MDVDARPNEMRRLWPKLPSAAEPRKTTDVRLVTPIAFVAAATTALASCACAGTATSHTSTATPQVKTPAARRRTTRCIISGDPALSLREPSALSQREFK